jgi:hypothetical protein
MKDDDLTQPYKVVAEDENREDLNERIDGGESLPSPVEDVLSFEKSKVKRRKNRKKNSDGAVAAWITASVALAAAIFFAIGWWFSVQSNTEQKQQLLAVGSGKGAAASHLEDTTREIKSLRLKLSESEKELDKTRIDLISATSRAADREGELKLTRAELRQVSLRVEQSRIARDELRLEFDIFRQKRRNELRGDAPGTQLGSLELSDGRKFTNSVITDIGESFLMIQHDSGATRVNYQLLPKVLLERYVFDPDLAAAERQLQLAQKQRDQQEAARRSAEAQKAMVAGQVDLMRKQILRLERINEGLLQQIRQIQSDARTSEADRNKAAGGLQTTLNANQAKIRSFRERLDR